MKKLIRALLSFIMIYVSSACTSTKQSLIGGTALPTPIAPTRIVTPSRSCRPTIDDGVSPSYKPNAPERTVVGQGHIVTGAVLSSLDCSPISNAKLEFWPDEEGLGHPDSSRATFFTDSNGRYRFECNPPAHIHMRVSAPGYRTIGVNSYHREGQADRTFDIVLVPEE